MMSKVERTIASRENYWIAVVKGNQSQVGSLKNSDSPVEEWANKVILEMSKNYSKAVRTRKLPRIF